MSAAAKLIQGAVDELHVAQRLVADLQKTVLGGLPLGVGVPLTVDRDKLWHALESIDDQLHNALGKLGD